ncbi:pectate lyase [Edaphobacter acidisoli]|uniref:Pectate lyase n=1 Tax=Edaphobacter acidisoli TaxID=2040573 RepID=A0A916W4D9_9BACT|nr:pectate lyase [Edaphobacter acidisoli]GGA66646.1 pectate lyase [Edaphobacter acidisoli]
MRIPSFLLCLLVVAPLNAAVIGASKPAESITAARIAILPKGQRAAWMAYLRRSEEQMRKDKAALAAERKPGVPIPPVPKEAFSGRSMPLHRDAAWYGSVEARHIADVIVSFQTPAGGWSKNLDMSGPLRQPGQSYTTDNISRFLGPDDFDTPKDPNWNYVGTLDNDATNTELHFLALVSGQTPGHEGDKYRASFLRGIHYLLSAQFPNGGWPQVWPLEGGYHDAITYNDNAVTESAETLTDVAGGQGDYAFVPAKLRHEAAAAADHALQCILATQIVVNGKKTVWAQQHDALTLQPVSGRNFEPAALSSGESSDVLIYLMSLPHPSAAVVSAINAGVAWLKQAAVDGEEWTGGRRTPGGRHLVAQAGAGPIWARYYSLTTGKSIFGDRDKTIHDNVNELSLERRNGYSWFSAGPEQAIETYTAWRKSHS